MSRTLGSLQAIVLAVALILGLGTGGWFVYSIAAKQWFGSDSVTLRAGFPSVQGVEVGTKVRIRGMEAGEVVEVEAPDSTEGQVQLKLRIRGKFRHLVRKDASVTIISVGMLGGKAIEIHPGTNGSPEAEDGAMLASRSATELGDVLEQVKTTLEKAVDGDGTVGKLARDPHACDSLVATLKTIQGAAQSIQADADAFKKVPLVGGYVEDPRALLDRPSHYLHRKWFPESDLFEPNRAALTRQGKEALDRLSKWIDETRHGGSDVVVVAYADSKDDPNQAKTRTAEQSKVVLEYLEKNHKIQKLGLVSWRKTTSLGMGINPSPAKERDKLPTPRIEVNVFVPQ